MKKLPRILMIPIWHNWYVTAHAEYLIRYLSDEFFMEIGMPIEEPRTPFMRNPDDYDLIWIMWPGHWSIDFQKYAHKSVSVFYCPNEGPYKGLAALGASTPLVEQSCKKDNIPYHSLRFGVDTNLFAPYQIKREDDLLHVGMLGNHVNVRHMVGTVVSSLTDIPGVKIELYPSSWANNGGIRSDWDGDKMVNYVVAGEKLWTGLPNIYNRCDVILRIDQDPAYSFPTQEAAACGVPVIATDSGIDHLFTEAGAGILIPGTRQDHMEHPEITAQKVREAVIFLRDFPEKRAEMAYKGRVEVLNNWTWEKCIPAWREFFREGLKNVAK